MTSSVGKKAYRFSYHLSPIFNLFSITRQKNTFVAASRSAKTEAKLTLTIRLGRCQNSVLFTCRRLPDCETSPYRPDKVGHILSMEHYAQITHSFSAFSGGSALFSVL